MASTAWSSKQFNNGLARQFYLNYDDTVSRTGSGKIQSADEIFFGFFQNTQATVDADTWNAWIINDSRSGAAPAATDTYYPEYFNTDTANWRNKFLYLVPCTNLIMVEKDSSGDIEYSGQRWSEISTWNEEEVTVGDEPRYIYYEADLKYYDSALSVSDNITSKNIITGLALYKVSLDGATGGIETFGTGGWTSVNYDDSDCDYLYYYNSAINTKTANTVYDRLVLGTSNLVYLYQNTFTSIVRTSTFHTKFSVIIEM
jgi:hypothetical protein